MKTICNSPKTTCVLIGYYDEYDNYREITRENIKLKTLPKVIAIDVYLDHDITMHISPGKEIRVFAKSMKDIETYLEIENTPNFVEQMLKDWSEYNAPSDDYIWTTFDFDELRERKALPPIEL